MKKYKYVYANGCSYTHGEGLNYISHYNKTGEWKNSDMGISDDERDEKYRGKWRYSKLLADKLGCKEINKACNGTSMDRAYRLITDFILTDERAKDSLIVWQLTYLERMEAFRNPPVGEYVAYPPIGDEFFYLKKEKKWIEAYNKYYYHPAIRIIEYMKKMMFLDFYCKSNNIGLSIFDGLLSLKGYTDSWAEWTADFVVNHDSSQSGWSPVIFDPIVETFYKKDILVPICGETCLLDAQSNRYKKDPKVVDGAYACAERNDEGNFKDGHPGKDGMIDIAESIYNKIVKGDIND